MSGDRGTPPDLAPNLVIPGVQKAGTTALFDLLAAHPEVDPIPGKEVHVYSRTDWRERRALFQEGFRAVGRYRLDASTSYFMIPEALRRLRRDGPPDLRLVVVLRDPVTRAVSAYHQVAKQKVYGTLRWYEDRPLAQCLGLEASSEAELRARETEAVERAAREGRIHLDAYRMFEDPLWPFRYLGNSLYAERIDLLLELFGRERILFLHQGQLRDASEGMLSRLADFLELPALRESEAVPRANPSRSPRKGGAWELVHLLVPYLRAVVGDRPLMGAYERAAWRAPDRSTGGVTDPVRALFRSDLERVRERTGLVVPTEA